MAEQKKKSQAERAVSAANSRSSAKTSEKKKGEADRTKSESNKKSGQQGKNSRTIQEKLPEKERQIPVRFYSASVCIGLFIIFLIMILSPRNGFFDYLKYLLCGLFGKVGFFVSIPSLLYLFFIHAFSGKRPVKMRTVCMIIFIVLISCTSHMVVGAKNTSSDSIFVWLYQGGLEARTGGVICGGIAVILDGLFGPVFPLIACIIGSVFTLLGAMQITIPSIVRAIRERPKADWEEPQEKPEPASLVVNHIASKRIQHIENKKQRSAQSEEALAPKKPEERKDKVNDMMRQISADVEEPVAAAANTEKVPAEPEAEEDVSVPSFVKAPERPVPVSANIVDPEPVPVGMPEFKKELPAEEPISAVLAVEPAKPVPEPAIPLVVRPRKVTAKEADESAAQIAAEIAEAEAEEKPEYCYPPIDLLKLPAGGTSDGTAEMRENTRRLSDTLASFKIEAKIINVTRGPSVTRYEVELEKGVRLNKLTTTADDIALSLGATSVRIAAIPGKISIVGIEVPNRVSTSVSLREVIDSNEFKKARSKSAFAVGKDIGGNCIVGNIAKLPHVLVAGTTGAGKSVCINSMIISLMYKSTPDDVKFIMIDPKMVEMRVYEGIPQLLIPVVTDPKKAAGSLQWAVSEMMRRYKAMSDAGVRDLESYNSIMEHEEDGKKLPQVVIFIDELADLMLVAAKEVEESICRIAQMGRAAGMHLVLATQRPSADVITGLMKANIPSRIALTVASAMESRIILDTQGAEKLCGRGDMLFAPIGDGKPKRVQGCYVSDGEVEAVANYVKNNFTADYDQQVMDEIEKKAAQTGNKNASAAVPEPTSEELDGDEMLPAAVDVILETGQASVSMLQRRLKLGYARAARIVDEMEGKGIVGPFQGSKPRSILVTKEQWAAMRTGGENQMNFEDLTPAESFQVPDNLE